MLICVHLFEGGVTVGKLAMLLTLSAYKALASLKLLSLIVPKELGGLGASHRTTGECY